MTPFPARPSELRDDWLSEALRKSGAIAEARVAGHETRTIGQGSGFIGELAQLSLTYDLDEPGAPRSLIAKFPAVAPENREVGMYFRFYEREVRFYEQVAARAGVRTPRCYAAAFEPSTGDALLLLEDLAPAAVGDQLAGCSEERARMIVRELARFHAKWWDGAELRLLDWMPPMNVEWQVAAVEQSYEQALEPFLEFAAPYITPRMRETTVAFGPRVRAFMDRFADVAPKTIVHGDYRLDNMFFASRSGGEPFAVIDWQIASRGAGAFDVAYFAAGTLPEAERRSTEQELVRLYHDTLEEHGVRGYGFDQCWSDYRTSILFLLVYSVIGIGSLDLANERGMALFTTISKRTLGAIEDLRAYEFLP